jgi:ribosomal protein L37AE/L43A
MPENRVQFQRGLSIAQFMERYGTEEKCEAAVAASRWPGGFVCQKCGGPSRSAFKRNGRSYWQCANCPHQSTVLAGTIFASTKLPLTVWFLAMHLLTQAKNNVSALELKRHLDVSYPSAWLIKHKLMEVMRQREQGRRLTGRVEIDDAYLGGRHSGGKTGRGSENKVPFVIALQTTEDFKPHLVCFSQQPFTKEAMERFAATSLALPLTLHSDGLICFTAVDGTGAVHRRTVTGGGKEAVELRQFRAVNTVLGNFKTALSGTYHAVKFAKYAHRYLAEVQYRFNRRYNLRSILPRLIHAAASTITVPEAVIRRC